MIKTIYKATSKNPNIINTYVANKDTLLVIPAAHTEYQSIVEERNATYCVRQTPLEIIKETCKEDYAEFEGRRKIIVKETGYKYKTPMLLRKEELIFAFPTTTATKFECSWIFLQPLLWIEKVVGGGTISFFNEKKFVFNATYYTLQSQFNKTQRLAYHIGGNKIYSQHQNLLG